MNEARAPRPPRLEAIRFVTRNPATRPPKAPLGLAGWSPEAGAVGVVLDPACGDLENIAVVAEQIPLACTLPPGTTIVVLDVAAPTGPTWQRLFGRPVRVSRIARCTALLVRGYVGIQAGRDPTAQADLTWGFSLGT